MTFNSLLFLCFWFLVWSAHWLLPTERRRHWLLLGASFLFYACSDLVADGGFAGPAGMQRALLHVSLLLGFMVIGWGCGLMTARAREAEDAPRAKRWMAGGVAACLLLLGTFKYTGFLLATLQALLTACALPVNLPGWQPELPVGISFFAFHAVCYIVDLYRRTLPQARNFRQVSLYIGFFPHLVAGPIVRATDFVPQLERPKRLDANDMLNGLRWVLAGFVAKCVFADHLAEFADVVFRAPADYDRLSLFGAVSAYYGQIYFDFHGYSLMAIGVAKTLGYWFPPNFLHPYGAASIGDFWRRWHVSLSCWLRDYLYIGLGGNRGPMMFVLRNLMLAMLLGGLWHGASWNFVLWGALHGSGLCVERLWRQWSDRREPGRQAGPLQIAFAWLFTQSFVLLCWIPFRCTSLADTTTVVQGLLGWGAAGSTSVEVPWLLILLPLLVDTFIIGQKAFFERLTQERTWLLHAVLIAGFFLALMLMYLGTKPFIYFQF